VGVLVGVQYLKKDIVLLGDYNINIPLNPPLINIKLEFNPFLIYGRAKLILLAVVVESTI
jgi:hypothetical protein